MKQIKRGDELTVSFDIINHSGYSIFCKGERVMIDDILTKEAFIGKGSGKHYPEEIYGVTLVGHNFEYPLSMFDETNDKIKF